MNKILAILLALVLLAGCAGRSSDTSAQDGPPSPQSGSAAQEVLPETDSDTPEPSPPDARNSGGDSEDPVPGEEASSLPDAPLTTTFTVPEGYTLARIGMTLEEKGICTAQEFIEAAQADDYVSSYPLVAAQSPSPNRCFALEGYLFPDTYEIYTGESPQRIIRRMLDHLEATVTPGLRQEIADSGYTFDEILAIASIIEKEAFQQEQMPLISSVLHNRLDSGMRLQCDVTIIYVEGAIKPFITGDINRYNSFYNTYKCDDLPAGAICNPGIEAIKAALRPASTDYFYFVTDSNKQYYYASTLPQHEENVARTKG